MASKESSIKPEEEEPEKPSQEPAQASNEPEIVTKEVEDKKKTKKDKTKGNKKNTKPEKSVKEPEKSSEEVVEKTQNAEKDQRPPKKSAPKEPKEKKKNKKPEKSLKEQEPEKSSEEVEKKQNTDKDQKPTKKYVPREPKGIKNKPLNCKDKSDSKDSEKAKDTDNYPKSKNKHDKLLKKGKRLNDVEEEISSDEETKVQKKTTVSLLTGTKRKKEHTYLIAKKDQDCSTTTSTCEKPKKLVLRAKISTIKRQLKFKSKTLSSQGREILKEQSILREESKEEKGHKKELVDSVYHNMELEVDTKEHTLRRKPEPVTEIKYKSFDDLAEIVHDLVNSIVNSFSEIFQIYKPNEILLSFNGGKDCTVVLHLLHKFYQTNSCLKHIKIPTLYITDPDAFEEVDDFVADCEKLFNIELIKKRGPIKKALEELCQEKPHIKAVFMGCRRTDPYCQDLKVMQTTDAGWPPLMRINPIIDWKCRDVWQYMYMYKVPYCSLYQKGYTSIGNKNDTKPNPYLSVIDAETGRILDYRPGHELIDNDELERAGRIKIPKETKTTTNSNSVH